MAIEIQVGIARISSGLFLSRAEHQHGPFELSNNPLNHSILVCIGDNTKCRASTGFEAKPRFWLEIFPHSYRRIPLMHFTIGNLDSTYLSISKFFISFNNQSLFLKFANHHYFLHHNAFLSQAYNYLNLNYFKFLLKKLLWYSKKNNFLNKNISMNHTKFFF